MSKDIYSKDEVGTLIEDFDSKLDLVLEHVKGVDTKVAHMQVTLDEHSEHLDRIEVRLDVVDSRLDKIDIRLDRIEEKLDTKADKSDLQKLDRRVARIETKTA